MRRTRRLWLVPVLAAALLAAGAAHAVTITLGTTTPTVNKNDTILLDVSVTAGLVSPGAPSLTTFEFDLAFDDDVLDFVGLTWSSAFNTCDLAGSSDPTCELLVDDSYVADSGVVDFAGASLVSPATVNANQPATGLLATLEFTAAAFGSTTPTFTQHDLLGTVSGETLGSLSFTESGTTLNVVPEPGTASLVAMGLAALGLRRRSPRP